MAIVAKGLGLLVLPNTVVLLLPLLQLLLLLLLLVLKCVVEFTLLMALAFDPMKAPVACSFSA